MCAVLGYATWQRLCACCLVAAVVVAVEVDHQLVWTPPAALHSCCFPVSLVQGDEEGAGLDELRAKTAAKFAGGEGEGLEEAPAPKRMRKNL